MLSSRSLNALHHLVIDGREWALYATSYSQPPSDAPTRFDVFVRRVGETNARRVINTTTGTVNVSFDDGPGEFELWVESAGIGWLIEVTDCQAAED